MAIALATKPVQTETPEVITKTRGVFQLRKQADDVWACSTVIYGSNAAAKTASLNFEGVCALFQLVGLNAPSKENETVIAEFVESNATSEQIGAFCLRMAV